MKEVHYQFDNVKVKLIDKSSHEERKQRLQKPLQDFFMAIERELHENKKIKTAN